MIDVLVFTCAAYSHLIPKFLTCFERTFPLPYQLTYIIAGTNRVQAPRNYNKDATRFVTMEDHGLAANILDYLSYRQSTLTREGGDTKGNEPFLMCMDDFMLFSADGGLIEKAANLIQNDSVGCVRLVPWPGPTAPLNDEFGTIDKTQEYAISLQASFWKPQTFIDLLNRSWSPWQIELEGSKRAATYGKRFIGCKTCAVNYYDYMMRGKPRPKHAALVDEMIAKWA